MPIYRCPICGRTVKRPEGTYYCSKCGQIATMVKISEKKVVTKEDAVRGMLTQTTIAPTHAAFSLLESAVFAAYTTLPKGSPRRVFVQDFAASLNRKGLLRNELVDRFCEYGYKYME